MQDLELQLTANETQTLIVETALPAHMMYLMALEIRKKGWDLREDIVRYLNAASAAPFKGLDPWDVQLLAKRTDDVARSILHDLSPDDPREGFMCVNYFVLKIVDEQFFNDTRNSAVMTALLLVEESKEHGSDWDFGEARMQERASGILTRAQLQGLYLKGLQKFRGVPANTLG